ncbi:Transferrin binding protein-like solute binding protein [Mannheimia haemolytica]|uniref:Transferrin binding protein-like solute binding protein n=1 Tax=Mannheimia haemolytica TaxID=75985 RepID=A0A378N8C1_MANHA|nr:Transferrin binding protein-like solute binding protein [Mannheimia haemolytica]
MYSKSGSAGAESPSNSESGTRSLFDVDFVNKKINGKLIANDGVEERPMLTLEGNLKGMVLQAQPKRAILVLILIRKVRMVAR